MVYPHTEVNQYALGLRLLMEKAYQQHMGLQHQRQKELSKSFNGDPFNVGDMLWLHCPAVPHSKFPKLYCFWQGPYRMHKVVSDVLYNISLRDHPCKHQVVHLDQLKPCVSLPSNLQERQQEPAETSLLDEPLMAMIMVPSYRLCLES